MNYTIKELEVNSRPRERLKQYGIKKCYYGHLHGKSHQDAIEGCVDGINFKLVSADYLNFDLIKI